MKIEFNFHYRMCNFFHLLFEIEKGLFRIKRKLVVILFFDISRKERIIPIYSLYLRIRSEFEIVGDQFVNFQN